MVETTAAEISSYEDGIVLIRFREGVGVEPQHADEIAQGATRVASGLRHGNLIDARKLMYLSQEARHAFARQERATVSGIAILVKSSLQRTIANLYLSVSRPAIPTRLFSDERQAAAWLREQNRVG